MYIFNTKVSIPQAVSTVATFLVGWTIGSAVKVSIPQAVSTVATMSAVVAGINGVREFQYRKR